VDVKEKMNILKPLDFNGILLCKSGLRNVDLPELAINEKKT
jgi:hypothetical protein